MNAKTGRAPDYLELTYSQDRAPMTDYPGRLAAHLLRRELRKPGRILDVGCGRGEFLAAFLALGFTGAGIDSAESAKGFAAGCEVKTLDLETEKFPYPDSSFDFVFSKSVVEHLHNPAAMLTECRRVLKPSGKAVIMTPSWRHTQRIFFEDFGHIKPFGANALSDAMVLTCFKNVRVVYFHQLPSIWNFPPLKILATATALLPLPYRPWDKAPWPEAVNKWIRFSKELMLLGIGERA